MHRRPSPLQRLCAREVLRLRRFVSLALIAWIGLVLAGREHALQALGLEVACVHPGTTEVGHPSADEHAQRASADEHAQRGSDRPGGEPLARSSPDRSQSSDVSAAPDAEDGDDCPIGCSGCACGGAVFAVPATFRIASRTWLEETFAGSAGCDAPLRAPTELDRPPRQGA